MTKLFKFHPAGKPRSLGNLHPGVDTNRPRYRRPGEAARDKRQREATAELAALFAPKKPTQ